MALEPIYEVAVLDGLQKLCSGQVVAEAKLVPPHGEQITKILGVSAVADVSTAEVFTGEARVKGKVDFNVLYSCADGKSRSLTYRADFTDKIADDAITGEPCAVARVLDTDVVSASENEIKLAAIVETELVGSVSKRIKYLVKGGDNIYAHEQDVEYTKIISGLNGTTDVTAESSIKAQNIECVESRICVNKAVASSDMVIVEGEIVSDVVYSTENGMDHIELITPYSIETDAEGAQNGSFVYANACIRDVRANIIEGEENTIIINYDVAVNGFVTERRSIKTIADVFSVRNELNKNIEAQDVTCTTGCIYFTDDANGNISLEDGLPIVDNIVTPLGSSVILSNAYATEGAVILEGIVRTNIIYYSGESNSYNSVTAEIPFSIEKALDVREGDAVFATAEVMGIATKIRRGNEIDVRADLGFCVMTGAHKSFDIITELSEGEEIAAPVGAISLHIANKKETLWDVSKALCATPETIMAQNPELSFPLSGGERIICYRKLDR